MNPFARTFNDSLCGLTMCVAAAYKPFIAKLSRSSKGCDMANQKSEKSQDDLRPRHLKPKSLGGLISAVALTVFGTGLAPQQVKSANTEPLSISERIESIHQPAKLVFKTVGPELRLAQDHFSHESHESHSSHSSHYSSSQ